MRLAIVVVAAAGLCTGCAAAPADNATCFASEAARKAACVAGTSDDPARTSSAAQERAAEPIAEAADAFGSKAFRFLIVVQDDGRGKGGGWQQASANLLFVPLDNPARSWRCSIGIGMPMRSEAEHRITTSRAAYLSAQLTTQIGEALCPGWKGPDAYFCIKFREGVQEAFDTQFPGLGARVSKL